MYEPITVEIDRDYNDGTHHFHSITFTGRLVQLIEDGYTTMRLYEWVDQGYIVYLVHVEEEKAWEVCPTHPLSVHQHPLCQSHTEEGIHRRGSCSGLPGVRQRGR